MRWIELYGLPGSGKTTLTDAIKNDNCHGAGVYTYNEIVGPNTGWFDRDTALFRFFSFHRFIMFLKIAIEGRARFSLTTLKRVYYVERICCVYCKYSSLSGYCIVDQGIIQAVFSIFHNRVIKNVDKVGAIIEKLFSEFSDSVILVHTNIQPEISLQRVRERNKVGRSRMDEISDDQGLLTALTILNNNFNALEPYLKNYNPIEVNMGNDIQKNVDVIVPYLANHD